VDAVIYSVIVDPVRATYEVQNLRWGLEQMTLSALRNVIGQLDLDHARPRDTTNSQLRAALDSATQQWGVKVMRIELKNINPPEEIRLTMEKQMTAERTRRAVVTTAEAKKRRRFCAPKARNCRRSSTPRVQAGGDSRGQRAGGARLRRAGRSAGDRWWRRRSARPATRRSTAQRSAISSRSARSHERAKLVFLPCRRAV
jgi:regulator of protease activity HflC (stomatin/prohibitin superfamily)